VRIEHMETPSPYTRVRAEGHRRGRRDRAAGGDRQRVNDALAPLGVEITECPSRRAACSPALPAPAWADRSGAPSTRVRGEARDAPTALQAIGAGGSAATPRWRGSQSLGPMLNLRLAQPRPRSSTSARIASSAASSDADGVTFGQPASRMPRSRTGRCPTHRRPACPTSPPASPIAPCATAARWAAASATRIRRRLGERCCAALGQRADGRPRASASAGRDFFQGPFTTVLRRARCSWRAVPRLARPRARWATASSAASPASSPSHRRRLLDPPVGIVRAS
jgi:hypothetical protein